VLGGLCRVEAVIGTGGMARVYQARHVRLRQKLFAVKVLLPEYARNTDVLARFQREAEAAASIRHPNVVEVYDVDRTPQGWPYMLCEHLDGVDLAVHLKQAGKLDVPSAARVVLQVCDALATAHQCGVIHRDMKPENVFLLSDARRGGEAPLVKVLDFGLSRFVDRSGTQLTRTGIIMGTPGYMAPEQAGGLRTDQRTDIYGIGAILYSALTGRVPFARSTPQMTVLAVMGEEPERPRAIEPSIPEGLELVIQQAMAKEPGSRYADVATLRAALEPFASQPAAGPIATVGDASLLGLGQAAQHVRMARPRLVALLIVTVVVAALVLAEVVAGCELLRGAPFTKTEFALLMLAVVGTAVTPAVLLVRHMRKRWNNSVRVLGWLESIRIALLTGAATYGLAALLVRVADNVVARFAWPELLGLGSGVAWRGYSLLLPVVALLGAATALVRWHLLEGGAGYGRRLVGAVLSALSLLVTVLTLYFGLQWRASTVHHVASPGVAPSAGSADSPAASAASQVVPAPEAGPYRSP
jgi:hypothetical protein